MKNDYLLGTPVNGLVTLFLHTPHPVAWGPLARKVLLPLAASLTLH